MSHIIFIEENDRKRSSRDWETILEVARANDINIEGAHGEYGMCYLSLSC